MSLNLDKSTWKRVTLGDVAQASKEKCDPNDGEVERYVAGEHMDTDDLTIHRWGEIGDGYLGPAFHRRFRRGQVLYGSRRTYLRKVAVADFDGVCANTTFVIQPKDERVLLSTFLPFILTAEPFHAFAIAESRGSVNPYVNWSDIARYEFDLPPLHDQKRIAELLWVLERHHHKLLIAAEQVSTVTRKYCIDVYRRCAAQFPSVPTEELGELRIGRQKAPRYATGAFPRPYIRVGNIGALELVLDDVAEMDFDPTELEKYRLEPGDLLLTEGDLVSPLNVGRAVMFRGEIADCAFQNHLIRFRSGVADPSFYLPIFEGMRLEGVFARAARTTTVTSLGLTRLAKIMVPVVSPEVQQQIALQFQTIRACRDAMADELASPRILRSSLNTDIFGDGS